MKFCSNCGAPVALRVPPGDTGVVDAQVHVVPSTEDGRASAEGDGATADAPPVRTILVETFEPSGPFGAKSIAEIGINGPLPAIANAIYDACGVRMKKAPFTPERVLAALQAKK